jgi:hypothetical protein
MKPSFLLIILILIAIPILLMSFTKARIEKQKYRVVKKDKEFEIRFYPPAIFATTKLRDTFSGTTKPPPR